MARARNRWGWGFQDAVIGASEARAAAPGVVEALGFGSIEVEEPLPTPTLPAPRVAVPSALAAICSVDDRDRACHSLGKSYLDTVRAFRGRYEHVVDLVIRPRREADVETALEWAADANVAVIPYGGGTSVVGGVEPRIPATFDGAASLDLGALDRVLEIDPVSRAARIGAGAARPAAGGAARRARAHDALLPAVLRALDARRLDRDARRRALRRRPDARRRPRRGRARDHAERHLGLAPAAGLGRRTLARPDAARLGGDPRRHHRGVGARAAAARRTGPGARCASPRSWPAPRRCGPSSRPACGPPTAASSTHWKRSRPARATASAPCSCSASSPPTTTSGATWPARSSSAAHTAASPTRPQPAGATARARGARPSCACPTCATCSSASGSSPTPSRPPSRGSACRPSTRP